MPTGGRSPTAKDCVVFNPFPRAAGVCVPTDSLSLVRLLGDLAWLHIFLARLTVLGFPSPVPLPSFGGKSWAMAEGMFWEIASFLARPDDGLGRGAAEGGIGALLAWAPRDARQLRSADLPDGFPASPAGVRCPHDGVQAASEREAEPVGERQAASRGPGDGGLLGVLDADRLEMKGRRWRAAPWPGPSRGRAP